MTGLLERPAVDKAPAAPADLGRQRLWSRLRVDLRLARRQALKGWSSSLLVITLVVLPMALVSGAIVFWMGHVPTADETIAAELGEADAWAAVVNGPDPSMHQYLDYPQWWDVDRDQDTGTPLNGEQSLPESAAPLLPSGLEVIEIGEGNVVAETAGGVGTLSAVIGDAGDPALAGRFELNDGRASNGIAEAMVSPGGLERLGAAVGDTLVLTEPAGTYTITGVMKRAEDADAAEVIFLPGAPALRALQDEVTQTRWYLPDWSPTPDDVRALNQEGVIVFDRYLYAHPGDMAAPISGGDGLAWSIVSVVGAGAAFAGYLVVLLAGAAFSVSARRQQRALAVAASVGASRASVFRVVLLQGTVLGLIGGVIGAAIGIGLGILLLHLLDDGSAGTFWGVHVPWPALVAVVVFAVVVGTIAAIAPARAATKGEVIAALRGARKPVSVRVDRPLWGSLLIVVGVALTAASGIWLSVINAEPLVQPDDARRTICIIAIIAGPILLQIGAILAGHWLISLLARGLSKLGLAPRIASRDAAANPGRIVPASAAIAACAFLAAVSLGSLALVTKQAERGWHYGGPVGTVSMNGWVGGDPSQAAPTAQEVSDVAERARQLLATADATAVATMWMQDTDGERDAEWQLLNPEDAVFAPELQQYEECPDPTAPDVGNTCESKQSAMRQGVWNLAVIAPEEVEVIVGQRLTSSQLATFRDGGALAINPAYVGDDGTIVFNEYTLADNETAWSLDVEPVSTTGLPAVVLDLDENRQQTVFLSPQAAERLGVKTESFTLTAAYDEPPPTSAMDRMRREADAMSTGAISLYPHLETGPPDAAPWLWLIVGATAVLVIGASSVALGLARVERRPDDATLAAVGGTRTLRRNIALWQGAIVAGVGAVVGTTAGLLPVWGVGLASQTIYNPPSLADIPWLWLAILALGLPLVIALVSWLVPPRHPDLTRRTAIA